MSIVDDKLAQVADDIDYWKSQIVAEPHRADRLLDRLQLHLRERDHLVTLSADERRRADELWRRLQAGIYDQALIHEYSAIVDGAA